MNDIVINWKSVTRGIPKGRHASEDRIPTIEEIQKLLQYPDVRIQPIVLTMISSGMRVGAWNYLRWKHIIPIKNDNDDSIIAAKIIVYAGEFDQYRSFITSETYSSLKTWIDYRSTFAIHSQLQLLEKCV